MATAKSESKPEPEVPVEAASEDTVPAADTGSEKTIVTQVWAPSGPVPKASVLQTAIQSVRDAIPVVFELEAEITGAKKKTVDKVEGTEFEVSIRYTPRATAGKPDPVELDKVIRGLDVPRSFDGIGGHDGDPDFFEKKPAEL